MVNFFDLDIKRVIMHTVLSKESGQEHAVAIESSDLLEIDENALYTILERLGDASEKKSKAFHLEIGDAHQSSFWGYAKDLRESSDPQFIQYTQKITQLLAQAQTSSSFPSGYLIIIDAVTGENKEVVIAIKAELQNAFIHHQASLQLLENVFLTPSQKLFKFGVIYRYDDFEKEELRPNLETPNDEWGCFLFDDQFRPEAKPAEYFYSDFLGFTVEHNPKIQTKKFYEATEMFIQNYVDDLTEKTDMFQQLDYEFTGNEDSQLSPDMFGSNNFKPDLKQQYNNEIVKYLPKEINKDATLITSNLKSKKITFPNGIKIGGPQTSMESNVEVLTSNEDLKEINLSQSSYTLVKIMGKPYSKE